MRCILPLKILYQGITKNRKLMTSLYHFYHNKNKSHHQGYQEELCCFPYFNRVRNQIIWHLTKNSFVYYYCMLNSHQDSGIKVDYTSTKFTAYWSLHIKGEIMSWTVYQNNRQQINKSVIIETQKHRPCTPSLCTYSYINRKIQLNEQKKISRYLFWLR